MAGDMIMRPDLLKLSQLVEENPDRDWLELDEVSVVHWHEFLLFNYSHRCQYKPPTEWNWLEKISRGLIYKRDGEVAAVPFQKFWNWGQIEADGPIVEVSEKLDGSLGIMFWDGSSNRIATRGNFESEQALWATDFLREQHREMVEKHLSLTLLFEIIYAENRIVVDYSGRRDISGLMLIGAIDLESSRDFSARQIKKLAEIFGFMTPISWEFIDGLWIKFHPGRPGGRVEEQFYGLGVGEYLNLFAKEIRGTEQEGWVVRTQNGQRLKIKGEEYIKYHRFISGFSKEMVIRSIVETDNFSELKTAVCPPYLQDQMQQWADEFMLEMLAGMSEIRGLIEECPHKDRKGQALWIKGCYPDRKDLQALFFTYLDQKPWGECFSKIKYGISRQSPTAPAASPESETLPPAEE